MSTDMSTVLILKLLQFINLEHFPMLTIFCFVVAGILTYFIPNIHQKVTKADKIECGPRPSVLSTSSTR